MEKEVFRSRTASLVARQADTDPRTKEVTAGSEAEEALAGRRTRAHVQAAEAGTRVGPEGTFRPQRTVVAAAGPTLCTRLAS